MMAMASILRPRLVFAAVMRSTILAIGRVVRSRMRRRLARAPICRRDRDADQPLDVAEVGTLFVIAERDGNALGPGTRGTPDAVDIALGDIRQVVVHHVADAVDIDAAGGNIGGNERAQLAVAESREHALALILRLVAVDRLSGVTGFCRPRTTLSAPCLVRVNTRTRSVFRS